MTDKHIHETTETRWQIWRSQSVAIVVTGFAIAMSWLCGWLTGMGL